MTDRLSWVLGCCSLVSEQCVRTAIFPLPKVGDNAEVIASGFIADGRFFVSLVYFVVSVPRATWEWKRRSVVGREVDHEKHERHEMGV